MKGRTTRCKEADISAVQNCKWIGEPVRTSTAICMWATRKSQRVHFFPPSGYIHLFYTFASERWCCLFSAIYSIMIISRQEKFAFKPKRIIKTSLRNFHSKILEMHLDSCKIFTSCCHERDHVDRSLNIAHRKSDSYDISPCADARLGMTSIVRSCFD